MSLYCAYGTFKVNVLTWDLATALSSSFLGQEEIVNSRGTGLFAIKVITSTLNDFILQNS